MKVLWFSNTPALGVEYLNKNSKTRGTGGWMYSLNSALQEMVDLSVVFHYPYKIDSFSYQKTSYFPVYTGNIIKDNLERRILGKVRDDDFLPEYLSIIAKVNPDIIHIHGTENSFLSIIGKTDIPVAVSIQGNLTVYTLKYLSGFHGKYMNIKSGNLNFKSLIFGRNSFRKGYNNMRKMAAIERKHLKRAKYIIGRTDWDRRITRVLAPKSEYYIGNEMLRDAFYNNEWKNPYKSGTLKLFTTNGNNYYKGFETLCHSLHLLNEIGINVEWRVAGIAKGSLIDKITRKHLKDAYPEKGLVLMGSLDENEMICELKKSHIYVMPSHIENSPNNLCEAMILGMPCIATHAGGTASMMSNKEEGILIQDGDPWVMAGAVLELMNDSSKSLAYGKAARIKALNRHNKDAIMNSLVKTYSIIIDKE